MRALALLAVCATAGCFESPAASPEEAYLRLLAACEKGDAALLFDALDTRTQWSIESVHHDQLAMRALILESYPPGDRERALSRIPAAVEEPLSTPRRYFRRLDDSAAILGEIKRRLFAGTGQPIGSVRQTSGDATVWRTGGSVFHFSRDGTGRWGFAELADRWEAAKVRANHDLDTVRANAQLYAQHAKTN